jgi:hypothetical protein
MREGGRLLIALFVVIGLVAVLPASLSAKCSLLVGTADGWNKGDASTGARKALSDSIAEWKAKTRSSSLSVTAMRPRPQPYWRTEVAPELYLKPDIVTSQSHTICWKGVVSPVVCSSGAKVCW